MRQIEYLINDVRLATDNTDINGVKDREIIRYFNDGVKSIQALIFKNNPLCSYFQASMDYPLSSGREFTLPTDCFADNAVSMVETKSFGSSTTYSTLERVWPEDRFFGWFTRNKQIIISGNEATPFDNTIRAWYFRRLPKFDKVWATVDSIFGDELTLTILDSDFSKVDNYMTFFSSGGVLRGEGVKFTVTGEFTVETDTSVVMEGDLVLMGQYSSLTLDLPEEVESYLLDYVASRIFTRNNYSADSAKLATFTENAKYNIIGIFGDAGQSIARVPLTDTDYLGL